ncbi:cadherin-like beta sandwich domain-containing protein [Paenibacillus massiliensis]|uniref:cadherin-like beta sandwich domain-containing protein n=1 Tax=Paenibacillus massiliensis TaxID=225917 RepID=UPI00047287EA|nr:cadherin-like beta sandwich domain-containing protein [Paenibacillus massiliensis]
MNRNFLNAKKAVSTILACLLVLGGIPGFNIWGGDRAHAATDTWTALGGAGISAGQVEYTSMAIDPQGTPYVAYKDYQNAGKATVMKYVNGQWESVGAPGLSAGEANELFLAIDKQGTPYLTYQDVANDLRLAVRKLTNGQWEAVGDTVVSASAANMMVLDFDSNNTPYVLYRDTMNGSHPYVLKFSNNAWATVGGVAVTASDANEMSLALDNQGIPYVAYSDGTDNYKLSVKKLNGNQWEYVGPQKLTNNQSSYHSIAIDSQGVPYVAFSDGANGYKTTILKFNGTQWETVGTPGITSGSSSYNSLDIDSEDIPYIAYSDSGFMYMQQIGVVKKFVGNQWQVVGNTSFSGTQTSYNSLSINSNDVPYVAFSDSNHGGRATVMKLASQYTVIYNGNGADSGIAPVDNQPYEEQDIVTVAGNTGNLERSGYIFAGWNTAADGSGVKYNGDDTLIIDNASVTLYAQWQNADATVTFETNGGTSIDSQQVSYNHAAVEPPSPERSGYSFFGWYTDSELTQAYEFHTPVTSHITLYAKWKSASAILSGLSVEQGTLEPSFTPEELDYQVDVAPEVTSLKFSLTKPELSQTLSVTGVTYQSVTDEVYTYTISDLVEGLNPVQIKVTAENGNSNTYNLVVNRLGLVSNNAYLGELTLSGGTLSPAFAPKTAVYDVEVDNATRSITVTAATDDENATMTVNGSVVTSGVASEPITLSVGSNPITIVVTAQNGQTKTYIIHVTRQAVAPSQDAALTAITIPGLNLTPAFNPDVEQYTATVNNATRSVLISVATAQEGASILINGTSGNSADIALTSGRNTVTIEVTAPDGSTKKTYTLLITRRTSSSDDTINNGNTGSTGGSSSTGGSTGGGGATPPPTGNNTSNSVQVLVNGQAESAGTLTTTDVNGQKIVTITVNAEAIAQKLNSESQGTVVTIPVSGSDSENAGAVIGELNGQTVKLMEDKQAVLVLQTEAATYTLPAQQIQINSLAQQLGLNSNASLESIKLQVEIARLSNTTVQAAESAAQQGGYTLVGSPVEFNVTATYDGKKVAVNQFNSYVERTIGLPANIDPSQITTGIVLESDGSVRHVPTKVTQVNGAYHAQINSLTNSAYSVIYNPQTFADVANHWSKTEVNDMGSRMIVSGVSNNTFEPDRSITRAEFAAVVVRALGLKPGEGSNSFSDVSDSDWYADVVKTASSYSLIGGYEDGTFRPQERITRQEAMALIARAMKVTGLDSQVPAGAVQQLSSYTDAAQVASWAKEAAAASIHTGLVTGRGSNTIAPQQSITRAETAAILRRLLQQSGLI